MSNIWMKCNFQTEQKQLQKATVNDLNLKPKHDFVDKCEFIILLLTKKTPEEQNFLVQISIPKLALTPHHAEHIVNRIFFFHIETLHIFCIYTTLLMVYFLL